MLHPVDVKIGKRIKKIRSLKGISSRELADKIGVSYQRMASYEMGNNRLTILELINIADVFDITVSYLVKDIGTSNTPKMSHMITNVMVFFDNIKRKDHQDAVYNLLKTLAN